jgi:Fe-S-cluster containining protein
VSTGPTRQQRRKLERELLKLVGDLTRDGLPVPHRPEATMALALAVREELSDTKTAARASKAAALIERVFDLTMRKLPAAQRQQPLACTVGCTYCCHNMVMATAPEIFLAARELRARHDKAYLAEVGGRCDAVGQAREAGARPPCPLLDDSRCTVYAARPAVCRKHNSFAVAACRSEHEGKPSQVPLRRFDQGVFECCAAGLIAGMRLWDGRAASVFELSGALKAALRDERSEQRWLAGEDVFAGVPSQSQLPGIDEHVAMLMGRLAGGVS